MVATHVKRNIEGGIEKGERPWNDTTITGCAKATNAYWSA